MINKIKYITIGTLIAIILFVSGLFIGKHYFSKTEIKIEEKIVYKTEWKTKIEYVYTQDNFDALYKCYQSPIIFDERIENNYLSITAFDDCKEATARYKIGQKGNWKIYLTVAGIGAAGGGYLIYRILK